MPRVEGFNGKSSVILRWMTELLLLRFLAESNRRKRFCRPVPNHSAKEPCSGLRLQSK